MHEKFSLHMHVATRSLSFLPKNTCGIHLSNSNAATG